MDTDTQIRASRLYLQATVQWLYICGRQLFRLCSGQAQSARPGWTTDSGIIDYGGDWLWTGGHVLDMSRWAFWKSRLAVLLSLEELDMMARDWARQGFRCMQDGSS